MIKITSITSSTNIDNLSSGIYNGIGWQIDGVGQAGYLIDLSQSVDYKFQIALLYASNGNTIKHRCYNTSFGWSSWKEA